ncbi:trimeric intracellular cation channel family protein [Asticcacaulis sp. EMRT-3]|uniref:trimeric intracellular cation channel family protein n=1 Tax=Asticcacaulis sp. EMRT-3 TaxID=3040349 RepID=UPI0024AFC00C|nr:trimeric intracellular cation channel family protein [Asticcacaulis sp. EMRT-3]MDI7776128.1 trimeric intracellular cation channel family protein [Asticcacaulis sp. EMRT-3]
MDALNTALFWLDYAAVAVFAATGALAAARLRQDFITFTFFAAITGVGGGTLRDLLIGAPVFWVHRPGYIMVCVAMAGLIWFVGGRGWRFRALLWLDALGMAAYAVVGTAKALSLGVPPFSAMIMGVLTTAFGGVIRDVLAGEPNLLLRRDIYITAALLGAATFAGLKLTGLSFWPAAIPAFVLAFGLRAAAIRFHLRLPAFQGAQKDLPSHHS